MAWLMFLFILGVQQTTVALTSKLTF